MDRNAPSVPQWSFIIRELGRDRESESFCIVTTIARSLFGKKSYSVPSGVVGKAAPRVSRRQARARMSKTAQLNFWKSPDCSVCRIRRTGPRLQTRFSTVERRFCPLRPATAEDLPAWKEGRRRDGFDRRSGTGLSNCMRGAKQRGGRGLDLGTVALLEVHRCLDGYVRYSFAKDAATRMDVPEALAAAEAGLQRW